MDLMLGFMAAMSVTMALIPPLMRAAGRFGVIDQPGGRRVHATAIPRVGGIAMTAGVLLALGVWGHFDRQLQAYCAGVLVLLVFGVWDDRTTLSAGWKLLGQAIAAVIAMAWGSIWVSQVTGADRLLLPQWVSGGLTFFFLIGVTNAINLADGLDGLAGGMALVCLGALSLIALSVGDVFVGTVALSVAGAILGFLRFNTYPARVFMGDCGSQILGFSVAVLSVSLTQDPRTAVASALPLLLLGIPVIDTLSVMTERVLAGHSPFHADKRHLHHRLLALGFDHHEAVMVIYLLQFLLFILAWLMRYQPDVRIVAAFLGFGGTLLGSLSIAARFGWRWRSADEAAREHSALARRIERWRNDDVLTRVSTRATAIALAVYGVIVVIRLPLTAGVRTLLGVDAAVLAGSLVWSWRDTRQGWLDKAALYVGAVAAVYVDGQAAASDPPEHSLKLAVFVVLALTVAFRVRWSRDKRFSVNPLDLLVVVAAVVVPNLPGTVDNPPALSAAVIKLVLLLYGLESLSVGGGFHWRWLSAGMLAFVLACLGVVLLR